MPRQLETTIRHILESISRLENFASWTNKYVRQILFDGKQEIVGARIRTYLLERSRIVFQPLRPPQPSQSRLPTSAFGFRL